MKIGDIVEFKKTKNRYRIAGFGRMRNPGNGKWVDAAIYEAYMDYDPDEDDYTKTDPSVYIRELEDFEDKFELSIPKVQIYNSETGQPLYDFGVSEKVLSEYFGRGQGGGTQVHIEVKPENVAVEAWCQTLAGDILIAGMNKEDERISQEVLDQIRNDLNSGKFGTGVSALAQIQMLLFFLTIKTAENYPASEGNSEEEQVETINEEELSAVSEEAVEDQE
jgi:hypothetical protein